MCYERRPLASDEHKRASADANRPKEQNQKREEVVSNLLREADKLEQKANSAPAKEYTPAK